jgi:hypothetical protein
VLDASDLIGKLEAEKHEKLTHECYIIKIKKRKVQMALMMITK